MKKKNSEITDSFEKTMGIVEGFSGLDKLMFRNQGRINKGNSRAIGPNERLVRMIIRSNGSVMHSVVTDVDRDLRG